MYTYHKEILWSMNYDHNTNYEQLSIIVHDYKQITFTGIQFHIDGTSVNNYTYV